MNTRRRWRLDGRVQGIGFRAYCEEEALARGVRGWVRNEFDGSVSIEGEAEPHVLTEFIRHVQTGHLLARIDHMGETLLLPKNDLLESFEIR